VNVTLDWSAYINTLTAKGRLHLVGAVVEPIAFNAMSLIMAQRSISGSPVGSPAVISEMLDFAARHNIKPKIELFDMDDVNQAIERLHHGSPRYRVVLKR
jgi:uncharacterized zinc-type alcohol dehydrogenase-like protein